MHATSRLITSAQTGIHDHLAAVVARHAAGEFKKPIMPYNRDAFDESRAAWLAAGGKPLILDAGCGVGLSTLHLAARFSDHFVIGVDQSAHRLARNTLWPGEPPRNCIRVRADLIDYWRLMHAAGIRLARHYLLYPNPWPKIGQLGRRWHGHPVFPHLVALGGILECRSNWRIYVEECGAALHQLTHQAAPCERYETDAPITPFERKYQASGHALWRCVVRL
ncbi:MAG TPA: SAM-dependent methyltransferase [Paucimonas sp.]|nr:SAM-dependent methyltransferase [Paucimonas sp.]